MCTRTPPPPCLASTGGTRTPTFAPGRLPRVWTVPGRGNCPPAPALCTPGPPPHVHREPPECTGTPPCALGPPLHRVQPVPGELGPPALSMDGTGGGGIAHTHPRPECTGPPPYAPGHLCHHVRLGPEEPGPPSVHQGPPRARPGAMRLLGQGLRSHGPTLPEPPCRWSPLPRGPSVDPAPVWCHMPRATPGPGPAGLPARPPPWHLNSPWHRGPGRPPRAAAGAAGVSGLWSHRDGLARCRRRGRPCRGRGRFPLCRGESRPAWREIPAGPVAAGAAGGTGGTRAAGARSPGQGGGGLGAGAGRQCRTCAVSARRLSRQRPRRISISSAEPRATVTRLRWLRQNIVPVPVVPVPGLLPGNSGSRRMFPRLRARCKPHPGPHTWRRGGTQRGHTVTRRTPATTDPARLPNAPGSSGVTGRQPGRGRGWQRGRYRAAAGTGRTMARVSAGSCGDGDAGGEDTGGSCGGVRGCVHGCSVQSARGRRACKQAHAHPPGGTVAVHTRVCTHGCPGNACPWAPAWAHASVASAARAETADVGPLGPRRQFPPEQRSPLPT